MKILNRARLPRISFCQVKAASIGFVGLFMFFTMTMSCDTTPEHIIAENHFDSLQLAPFVEPDFPFITTSIDLREMGHGLPDKNLTSRGIIMNLGPDAYACFDTDLLRWSVAWTGDFISLTGMAQISYDDFFNKRNQFPRVLGNPQFATGLYPGWRVGQPDYDDPRVKRPPYDEDLWGPIPVSLGRWEGLALEGNDGMVLNYTVDGVHIEERPGVAPFEGEIAFSRNLAMAAHESSFFLNLAEVSNGFDTRIEESGAYIVQGENQDTVTAVGLVGEQGKWHVQEDRFLTIEYEPADDITHSKVLMWKGPVSKIDQFQAMLDDSELHELKPVKNENITRWPEKVYTKELKSPDTAAYVTDQLLLPIPNPWNRNIRIMDVAFFEDGRGAAVSYDGDVWMVDGIGDDYLTWTRYASGLNQPMSIEIVEDVVYVFDRMGIIRFHDNNGDGEADFYENFSNIVDQSMETREWPADLVLDPDGGFYIAKGGSLAAGPHIGKPTVKGFVRGSQYDGSVLHISEDGRDIEVMATGLRGPYLGIHPENGYLTVTDQQGNWVPSTPVYHVQKGDYYGVPSTMHWLDTPQIADPLLWSPHNVEPSSIGQTWMVTDKMGPLNGQLVHMSFGKPGLYKILIDTVGSTLQGGLIYIPAHYPTPVSKGAIRDRDGYPYVTGFNLWGSASKGISSLLRLRYTGMTDLLPVAFEAGREGIILRFDAPLDEADVANIGNFQVKRYNYARTEEYGSGHFRLDGSPGEEHIPVLASHLSEDQKSVLLVVPNMVVVEQIEVDYAISSQEGQEIAGTFAFTLHDVQDLELERRGFSDVEVGDLTFRPEDLAGGAPSEQKATVELGEQLFAKMACIGCHSPETRTEGLYGPPFQDLYGSVQKFTDGTEQLVDEVYLHESIMEPAAKIVEGYSAEMPSFLGILNDAEVESIILYIKSLSSHAPI